MLVEHVRSNAPYWPPVVGQIRFARELFRLPPFILSLMRHVKRADVVHVMANSGLAWYLRALPAICIAKWSSKPLVVNYRGGLAAKFLSRHSSAVKRGLDGSTVVVPSRYLQTVFEEHGVKCTVVPNMVDSRVFRPAAPRLQPRSEFHVVVARNLEKIYGVDLAIDAVAELVPRFPGLRLSIAGSGPEFESLRLQTTMRGLTPHVVFTGNLTPEQMADLYRSADAVLNPVRADNMPNSMLEAIASGVPIVSTCVGGIPYLLEHNTTALLAEPESAPALAAALERLISDGDLRDRLIANGLELSRLYAWESVRERWKLVYDSARSAARHVYDPV